ncbi:hypothetical protein GCM10027261_18640 [Geodermatophilus arenarius]
MRVQVAAEGGAELGDVVGQRHELGVGLLEPGQVLRHLAGVRLHDRGAGLGADAAQVGERARADPPVELLGPDRVDDGRRGAERGDPVRGLAGALQEEGDPPERGRGSERCAQLAFLAFLAAFFWALAARRVAFS